MATLKLLKNLKSEADLLAHTDRDEPLQLPTYEHRHRASGGSR